MNASHRRLAPVIALILSLLGCGGKTPSSQEFQEQLAAYVEAQSEGRIALVSIAESAGAANADGDRYTANYTASLEAVRCSFETRDAAPQAGEEIKFSAFEEPVGFGISACNRSKALRSRGMYYLLKGYASDVTGTAAFVRSDSGWTIEDATVFADTVYD